MGLVLALATAADASECRRNCAAIFKFCKQGCVDNYSGVTRRAGKIGCRKAKAAATRVCRQNPQVCPPIE